MYIYGKPEEKQERAHIESEFDSLSIIDPGTYQDHPEKKKDTLGFCYKLIDGCTILVFTKFLGFITAGVGEEVNYALRKGIKVYELVDGKFVQMFEPVKHLTREETNALYWKKTLERLNGRRLTKRK